jgi:hypothetical protein
MAELARIKPGDTFREHYITWRRLFPHEHKGSLVWKLECDVCREHVWDYDRREHVRKHVARDNQRAERTGLGNQHKALPNQTKLFDD